MKRIITGILFSCLGLSFINAQVVFNKQDSLYYLDSSYKEIADGVVGFYDDKYFEDTGYWLEGDSIVLELEKGKLISKAAFDRNDKYQKSKYYYQDNQIVDGVYEEVVRVYNRKEKTYVETVYRYSFVNGKEDGVFYEFYRSNPDFIKTIGSYKNGLRHGYMINFKNNGLPLKEWLFKNGKSEGLTKTYYEDINRLKFTGEYENNLAHGEYKSFWRNGQLRSVLTYVKGQQQGLLKAYLEDGELAFIQHYEDDKLIKTEIYKEKLPAVFTNEFLKYPDYTKAEIIKKY
tara:strand:- start:277 stop:1140 length:864 start_codon:yes stop_codon:yes gene_type:complete